MGEDQVGATAVDVESDAQDRLGHRRALDVPPGPAAAPRRVPRGVLAGFLPLPEGEVEWVALALRSLDALALIHLVDVAVAELPVFGVAPNTEIDVSVRRI